MLAINREARPQELVPHNPPFAADAQCIPVAKNEKKPSDLRRPEHGLKCIKAMISRAVWDRQRFLIQDGNETGRVTFGREIEASVWASGGNHHKRASRNEPSTDTIDVIDDLVVGSFARLLGQLAQLLGRLNYLLDAILHWTSPGRFPPTRYQLSSFCIPALSITPRHLDISVLITAANSAGAFATGSKLIASSRLCTSGRATIVTTSRYQRSMISRDVPAGNTMPCQNADSWPAMSISAMVGMLGKTLERLALVTASARNLASLMLPAAAASDMTAICVCPATVAVIAGMAPLNGTCARSRPHARRNISPAN